jgi:glyoxylase-like metal-dependent hydrolase (beta-lactamase superfamily II)
MRVARVGSRGHLFRFDDPYETYVYAMAAADRVYLCDTYVGPGPMAEVREYPDSIDDRKREIIVFNSHAGHDHFWGNCFFDEAIVIGHEGCWKRIVDEGGRPLQEHEAYMRGEVTTVPPQVTFTDSMEYSKDGVLFCYTPGHTGDSSSCFDKVDRVLFVGDNLEHPLPYVKDLHFDRFIATLHDYSRLDWNAIATGHRGIHTDRFLLNENTQYLEDINAWRVNPRIFTEAALQVPVANVVIDSPPGDPAPGPRDCQTLQRSHRYADTI